MFQVYSIVQKNCEINLFSGSNESGLRCAQLISKMGITRPFLSGLSLNLFSKLLFVKKLKYDALIGQKRVKRERESRGLVIRIFNICTCVL